MIEETLDDWWRKLSDDEKVQTRNAFDDQGTSVNISSNVLFHFTSSYKKLISILSNGFYPQHCPEYGVHDDQRNAENRLPPPFAFPMICFCDLPLFLIRRHLSRYGPYGIGMKKRWGMEVGVCPVMYVHPKANTLTAIKNLSDAAGKIIDDDVDITGDLVNLIAYEKLYEGMAWRDNDCAGIVRFYNEREWRYVPPMRSIPIPFLQPIEYQNPKIFSENNDRLAKLFAQKFTADDVLYTIVRSEGEVDEMILRLRGLDGIGGNKDKPIPKDIQILETTVSSAQRIMED